jgi:hypothetical protein
VRLVGFFGKLGFYERLEVCEIETPESAVLIEPGIDGAEGFGIELVDAVTAVALLADQVRATEQAQVLGNGGAGDGKGLGNVSGGLASAAQEVEDGAAGGIGESLEGCFGGICNRTVTHDA